MCKKHFEGIRSMSLPSFSDSVFGASIEPTGAAPCGKFHGLSLGLTKRSVIHGMTTGENHSTDDMSR